MTRVLVTGGTGGLGRALVPRLRRAGYTVRVMSRRSHPPGDWPDVEWAQADIETGQGLAEALRDAPIIVHAATSPFRRTQQIDVDGTRRLLEQAKTAGAAHFIYTSIVGIERIPFPYYRHKVAAEALTLQAGVPWSIWRATQFHTLIDGFLSSWARGPVILLPADFQIQPIEVGEAAEHLCAHVGPGPAGRLPEVGGPEVLRLGDMARAWLEARGLRRPMIHVPLPGGFARAVRRGDLTCPQQKYGQMTWSDWVKRRYRR